MSKKIVILGNGYVGKNLYDRLLFLHTHDKYFITLVEVYTWYVAKRAI